MPCSHVPSSLQRKPSRSTYGGEVHHVESSSFTTWLSLALRLGASLSTRTSSGCWATKLCAARLPFLEVKQNYVLACVTFPFPFTASVSLGHTLRIGVTVCLTVWFVTSALYVFLTLRAVTSTGKAHLYSCQWQNVSCLSCSQIHDGREPRHVKCFAFLFHVVKVSWCRRWSTPLWPLSEPTHHSVS